MAKQTYQHPVNMQKAVAKMILDHPFFASLYLRLDVRPEPRIPTCGVCFTEMVYNPKFFEGKTVNQLTFILCHEMMHLAMMHPMRLGARDPKTANIAGDYAINLILKDAGLELPKIDDAPPLIDEKFRTAEGQPMAMEQIYNMIYSKPPEDGEGEGEGEGDGEGEGEGKGSGQGEGDGGGNGEGEGEGDGEGEGEGKGEGSGSGSGNGNGNGSGKAPNVPDEGGCGGFYEGTTEDGNKPSESELSQQMAEMEIAVQQAAQAAKSCGKLPASLQQLVGEMTDHVMDWRDVLRNFIQKTARDSYNWNYPNRRHIGNGTYLPSRRGDELKPIMVAFDNSGSVSNAELERFGAELNGILGDSYPCTVTTVEFDTSINHGNVQTYTHDDYPINLVRTRCGGTAFAPVFDYAEEKAAQEGQEWAAVIVMTDMCAPMPTNEPHCPTLWVSTHRHHEPVNFGEVAYIMD